MKRPPYFVRFCNQVNKIIPENNRNSGNVIQSKYYGIRELKQFKIPQKDKCLSRFHVH